MEVDWVRREVRLPGPLAAGALETVRAAAEAAERSLRPASPEERGRQIARLVAMYPVGKGEPGELEQRWKEYHKALGDLPLDLLGQAVDRAMAECRFFPRPAELRAFIADALERRRVEGGRLSALARFRVSTPQDGISKPDAETRKRQIAELLGKAVEEAR